MKTFLTFLVILGVASAPAIAADDPAAAHDALRVIKSTYEKAVATGDLAPLKELFAPDTTAVMALGTEIKSFSELEEHWKYVRALLGEGGTYATTLNPEPSLIFGDLAIARGTSDDVAKTGDGREFRFQTRWTAVCRLIDGQWKVLRLHASMDPVNNVFIDTFLKKAKTGYGLGGLALGAALGLVIGRLTKRRASSATA
jgi:ketosteroid isomerase-like protein